MGHLYIPLAAGLLCLIARGNAECFPGCTCASDRHGRSVFCMGAALDGIPAGLPDDLAKIRVERSRLPEVPRALFSRFRALEHLWLNFNAIAVLHPRSWAGLANLTELRLQGNQLRSVPWTAFQDTPALRVLDLKRNRVDALPEQALRYLAGLTYLDLSFNRLTVIAKEVFLNWALYHGVEEGVGGDVVLALHENPWTCDCRLKGFVDFVVALSPPIILMNSYLTCAEPKLRAGKFFHEVELRACAKPAVTATTSNVTAPQGGSVTLTCLATGRPEPAVWWTYGLKILRGFNESLIHVDEDTMKSQLMIPSLHLADRGVYTCTANNFVGNSSINIMLDVRSSPSLNAPAGAADENVYIDIRIAKQTVYGITIEWFAVLERPSESWFTIHFGQYDVPKKDTVYIGPGINTYSVSDLLPATKYEICVALKNQAPRAGQCVVFVTGSDISELEQREKLIHIVVIVFAMVLAVPAGMYACTTDTKFTCFERCTEMWKDRRRSGRGEKPGERQGTFDSLQAASDDDLCKDSGEEKKTRRRSEDKTNKALKADHRATAQL
ncbi:leucine-rich repeat, immunoglobulin-like domain and transmembrane domain-containing protein 2 [Denticeps clupeoides]|uniref:Ig-like domain-containing protein n=1 Tax=Denticeps clupeoides TaxID=299321 RepID=A0AAY4CZD6_9TELE|nr:leucine-rich repeat, immunoglobulin-like domain and transmembrane domain-containing protein 2 [Denticeps clupeoides]